MKFSNGKRSPWLGSLQLNSDRMTAVLLFVGFILLRIPFLSHYPVNWDAVQFVLGTQEFDLHHHQPHPPGYIGYIYLGRLLNQITGDPHLSLTLMSLVSGAVAPAIFFLFARHWLSRRLALVTALLFGTSPLLWYYSEVALTYSVEIALAVPFVWFCYRARDRRSARDLMVASVLLVGLGAVRQSGMIFLLPLWLYAVWAVDWRLRFIAAAVYGVGTLLWLVPLLWLSGGPGAYYAESTALAELVSDNSSITAVFFDKLSNLTFVSAGLILGLTAGLAFLIVARQSSLDALTSLSRQDRIFFALWAVPALLTYTLGHTGQLGYVLLLLPIFFLWIGWTLSRLGDFLGNDAPQSKLKLRFSSIALIGIFLLTNTLTFTLLPGAVTGFVRRYDANGDSTVSQHIRQYDIAWSDEHWQQLIWASQRYSNANSAILTTIGGPRISGSYRVLASELDDHLVYGLGKDQSGVFGHLFTSRNGDNNYSVAGLSTARRILILPPEVRYLVIPDPGIINQLDRSLPYMRTTLMDGTDLIVATRTPGTNLAFQQDGTIIACVCSAPTYGASITS